MAPGTAEVTVGTAGEDRVSSGRAACALETESSTRLETVGEFLGSARAVADGIKMAAAEIEDAAVALLVVAPGEVDPLCL